MMMGNSANNNNNALYNIVFSINLQVAGLRDLNQENILTELICIKALTVRP
jgi:hypothetical protein